MALDLNCGDIAFTAPYVPKTEVGSGLNLIESYVLPNIHRNRAGTYVRDALANSQEVADKYAKIAEIALTSLGNFQSVDTDAPGVTINIDEAPDFDVMGIERPVRPNVRMPEITGMPSPRGDLQQISIGAVGDFTERPPDAPTETLDYTEDPYISPLLTRLQTVISDVIYQNGSGLGEEYERLVRERAMAQSDLEHELKYQEVENYYDAKGYTAPPGALVARLDMLNREKIRKDGLLNGEITAKLMEMARTHREFMSDLGVKLEQLTIGQKNDANTRALDAAKAVVDVLYNAYGKKLEGFKTSAEVFKVRWGAEETKANAISAGNKNITDMYQAELQSFSTRITAELSLVEQIVKLYIADMTGYETNIKAEAAKLTALVESYKAKIGGEEVKGTLRIEEFKALVQKAISEVSLRITSQQESGRIAAQIAASALSVFNASASLGDSVSSSGSFSESKNISYGESFSQSIGESFSVSVGQSTSCGKSQSESFIYSASV